MTFKIKADPTFKATLTITGQGREQQLNVTFKHMPRKEYLGVLEAIKDEKVTVTDALLKLVADWDADMPLNAESLELLREHQPGSDWAIVTSYGEALVVARKGN